jgi:hypothetical protein
MAQRRLTRITTLWSLWMAYASFSSSTRRLILALFPWACTHWDWSSQREHLSPSLLEDLISTIYFHSISLFIANWKDDNVVWVMMFLWIPEEYVYRFFEVRIWIFRFVWMERRQWQVDVKKSNLKKMCLMDSAHNWNKVCTIPYLRMNFYG